MHQTMYRKYRPHSLDEIYGQDVIVTILKNQIKAKAISHAYLFTGPRGTGKTSVAKILAKVINCEDEAQPCGNCSFCKMRQEENLDIIEIDAASNNGVDEIRELKRKINLTPSYGQYKVYIVDEVHMLTTSAFNALLKTLEEPPPYVLFVLATTEPHKVPETILSRCQRMDFKRLTDKAIIERLLDIKEKEKINIEEFAIQEIARLAQGGMRDAIGLLEQATAYNPDQEITAEDIHTINSSIGEKELEQIFIDVIDGDFESILTKTEKYYNQGKNVTKILEEIINYMRKCLLEKKLGRENSKIVAKINEAVEYGKLLNETIELNKFLMEMKNDSNPKALLEIALVNLANNIEKENDKTKPVINLLGNDDNQEEEKQPANKEVKKQQEKNPEEGPPKKEKAQETPKKKETQGTDLEALKRLRIDNTFSKVSKNFKRELEELLRKKKLVISKEDKKGHLLIDGEIKAASEENQYFIIVFESNAISEAYNKNIKTMETLLEKKIKMKLKSIALSTEEWEQYRQEFKEKKREYKYKKENGEADKFLKAQKKETNEIEKKFGDLVQKY